MTVAPSTTTELANLALDEIGANITMVDLDSDTSRDAKTVRRAFWKSWDATLMAAPWNCARKRVALASLSQAPAWGFSKYYALPADFISMQEIYGLRQGEQWEIDTLDTGGSAIACDIESPIKFTYTYRLRDVSKASPMFLDAFVSRLGMDISMPIHRDPQKQMTIARIAEDKLNAAKAAQGRNRARRPLPDSEILTTRD